MLIEEHFNNECLTAGNPTTFVEKSFAPSYLNILFSFYTNCLILYSNFFKGKKCQCKKENFLSGVKFMDNMVILSSV